MAVSPRTSFRDHYAAMIRRHLGRDPTRSDGLPAAAVKACERRLGVRLPETLREYYLMAGRLDELNKAYNRLFTVDELRIKDAHLWFMEENQAVVHWGLLVKHLSGNDPVVYQRANVAGAKWYSERMPLSKWLVRMYDWQAGFADPPR